MKSFAECFFDFICSEEGLTRDELLRELRENGIDFDALEKRATDTMKKALAILRKKVGKQ